MEKIDVLFQRLYIWKFCLAYLHVLLRLGSRCFRQGPMCGVLFSLPNNLVAFLNMGVASKLT